jgi:polysaccharide export outer membrane protein
MRAYHRCNACLLAPAAALFLFACSWLDTTPRQVGDQVAKLPEGVAAALKPDAGPAPITALRRYRVVAGDELAITLAGTQTLLGNVTVSSEGSAVLPRKGETRIAGLSLDEIEAAIENNHDGGVKVRLKAPPDIYVVGAVQIAGGIPYTDGLTLEAALIKAGGATHRADLRKVFITPRGDKELGADFDPALPILPGDVVRLKERYY